MDRHAAGVVVFLGVGLLGGIGAQQVMESKPARDRLSDQAGPAQLAKGRMRPRGRYPRETGGGRGGDIRTRVKAEKPERSLRLVTTTRERGVPSSSGRI